VGGLDCCGVACGEDIKKRVISELSSVMNPSRVREICAPPFEINDCNMPWWTGKVNSESKTDIERRVREFISFIQFNGSNQTIFVGHSMFFREFLQSVVSSSPTFKSKYPELATNMTKYKLQNCTMLGLTIIFNPNTGAAQIEDASLMFGGGFDVHVGNSRSEEDVGCTVEGNRI
jgi:hypothetical protein